MQQAACRLCGAACIRATHEHSADQTVVSSTASTSVQDWCCLLQASFEPPGLSVSVKKDRAVENLMAGNDTPFIINVVASGRERAIMKQLTKSFKPGEDRFAGLDTQVSTWQQYTS